MTGETDHALRGVTLEGVRAIPVRGPFPDIADHVVRAVAQPSGAIFSHMASGPPVDPPETGNAFDSVVRFHSYWRSVDPAGFEPVRLALERAIVAERLEEVWPEARPTPPRPPARR